MDFGEERQIFVDDDEHDIEVLRAVIYFSRAGLSPATPPLVRSPA
jgi:hypothetical protein